jgi:hypothetical protein
MKWPDGTPKSQNNAFDWRSTAGLSMAADQVGINNGKSTSQWIESERASGKDVRAVARMGSEHILRQRQVIAYSKAKK